jgi:two-component system chemotaxis response regulator CheB
MSADPRRGDTAGKPVTLNPALRASPTRPRVVGIGASTGGPNALAQALPGLAAVSALVPILIVQHMPELFTRVLAEQLRIKTGLAVAEAEDGEPLQTGRVYLAPGGCHMGVTAAPDAGATIRLDGGEPVHHCRPAVDILFADLARVFGAASLGIVLTGMGRDGTEGAAAIVGARGTIFAQDEATSTIWGMPGSVVRAGLARRVLPLGDIAGAVGDAVGRA